MDEVSNTPKIEKIKVVQDKPEISLNLRKSRRSFFVEYGCAAILFVIMAVSLQKQLLPNFSYIFMGAIVIGAVSSAEFSRFLHRCKIAGSKIVITEGLIRQQKKHIFVTSITDINTRQDFKGRVLGYGTIHLKSSSGEQSLHLRDSSHPEKVMIKIETLIEKYKNNKTL